MMNRRDLLGRLIGTLGFGIFSSKSCVDYLVAREQEQLQRKEYVNIYCRVFDNTRYLNRAGKLPPHAQYLAHGMDIIIQYPASIAHDPYSYYNDIVIELDKIGLMVDKVGPVYVEYQ